MSASYELKIDKEGNYIHFYDNLTSSNIEEIVRLIKDV